MKKIFFVFLLLLSKQSVTLAQDLINLVDGNKIQSTVIEVTPYEIKYKLFTDPDGPLFVIDKRTVAYITYRNGLTEKFNAEISKTPVIEKEKAEPIKKFHIGIIPYQLFSRSSGLYVGYNFNAHYSLEYRPTYTFSELFGKKIFIIPAGYDWNSYTGINNALLILRNAGKLRYGLLLGYKYWWYNSIWMPADNGYSKGSPSYYEERRSSIISGPTAGFDFDVDISRKNIESAVFFNITSTIFDGKTIYYEAPHSCVSNTYPKTERISHLWLNIALGLKFGYRR